MSRLSARLCQALEIVRTIRVRLTLWYVALLALILLVFCAFLYVSLAQRLSAEVDRSLQSATQQVAASLEITDGRLSLGDAPDALPSGTTVVLYDRAGTEVVANAPRSSLPVLSAALGRVAQSRQTFQTVQLQGDDWRVLTTPLNDGAQPIAVLQLARSEEDVAVALRQLVLLMGLAVPATLLVAIAGGLFLAGRALDPIDRITRTAARIGVEDLSRRIGFSQQADELGRLAATFDQMLDRLEAAFQRQRQFTADASHELRTPLAMLQSEIDVALQRRRAPAQYEQLLASLREDATRMSQLLAELLTLARADAGHAALEREALDIEELACQVLTAMQPLAESRGVRLLLAPVESVTVLGDQTRLMQLLVNLVDNGLKYTLPGGSVSLAVRQDAASAILEVTDTGQGIAPEHLPHVFERFYRADAARGRAGGGAGLGLAICQWIAEAHGGTVTVQSAVGRGTTVTVRLPATLSSGAAASNGAPPQATALTTAPVPRRA